MTVPDNARPTACGEPAEPNGRETQARVRAAIAQTGYVPNAAARSLVLRRRTAVGLVMAKPRRPIPNS